MKSSGEEERRVMEGGGGDLKDWKMNACKGGKKNPNKLDGEEERRRTISA